MARAACGSERVTASAAQVAGRSEFEVDVFALNVTQAIAEDLKRDKKAPIVSAAQLIEMIGPRLRIECEASLGGSPDRLELILEDLQTPGRLSRIIEDLAATGDLILIRGTAILDAVRWCSQLLAAFINDLSDAQKTFDTACKSIQQLQVACAHVGIHIDTADLETIRHLLVNTLEVCFDAGAGRVCFPCLLPSPPENEPIALPARSIGCGCRFECRGRLELIPPSVFNAAAVRARGAHPSAEVFCSRVAINLEAEGMVVRLQQRWAQCIELTVVADRDKAILEVLHDQAWRWIELVRDVLRDKAPGLAVSESFPCYECISEGRAEPPEFDVSAVQDEEPINFFFGKQL